MPIPSDLDESSVVYVENHGDEPLTFKWGGRAVTVHPTRAGGKGKVVQWPAVVNALGNPYARDHEDHNGSMIRDRADEVGRLSVRYGLCNASMYTSNVNEVTKDVGGPDGHTVSPYVKTLDGGGYRPHPRVSERHTMRHPNLPRCHVYVDATSAADPSQRDAARIFTVIDDPDGLGDRVEHADQGDVDTLHDQVANLTRQLTAMQNQLAAAAAADYNPPPVAPASAHIAPDVGQAPVYIGANADLIDEVSAIEATVPPPPDASPTGLGVNPLDPDVAAVFGRVEQTSAIGAEARVAKGRA